MAVITFKQVVFNVGVPIAIPNGVQTVVIVTPRIPLEFDTARIVVKAYLQVACGADTTNLRLDIYRGISAAGVLLNNDFPQGIPAFTQLPLTQQVVDAVQGLGEVQYAIAITPTAATAPGSIINYCVELEALAG